MARQGDWRAGCFGIHTHFYPDYYFWDRIVDTQKTQKFEAATEI